MGLTRAQETIWQRARALGSGEQAVGLADSVCSYLVARIVSDLDLIEHFPELPASVSNFYSELSPSLLRIENVDAKALFERLLDHVKDADTYFACLAVLHKARLKYERILSTQSFPTLEQVGPRSLLQYGSLSVEALSSFLAWRKWFFDIDNRAGQETGYLFEPVIAFAIGGTPAPSSKSPVRRHADPKKGRQVDCILNKSAYEFKIRVTIAASGQGRWKEELDFPIDCKVSGFKPILICLDSTPNTKLTELIAAFERCRGKVFIGEEAWQHLEKLAGETMSKFLKFYIRDPIKHLLTTDPQSPRDLHCTSKDGLIEMTINGNERISIIRSTSEMNSASDSIMPPDADVGIE